MDIKEIAMQCGFITDESISTISVAASNGALTDVSGKLGEFAKAVIAAYVAEQEPGAWHIEQLRAVK